MKTRRVVVFFIWFIIIAATSAQSLYAQLDTLGFPMAIGTKWFYRYTSKTFPSSLSNPGVPIYNSSLTRDTTWRFYGSSYSYDLKRALLFGTNLKSQTLSYRYTNSTFSEFIRVYSTALGIGIFYQYYHTWGQSISWTEEVTLIGLLKGGKLYGDSLQTAVKTRSIAGSLVYRLEQNYPNPFNPLTNIKFKIPRAGHVTLKVYNLQSQVVAKLLDRDLPEGEHQIVFTPIGLASGMYFYRIESGSEHLTRKMLLLE